MWAAFGEALKGTEENISPRRNQLPNPARIDRVLRAVKAAPASCAQNRSSMGEVSVKALNLLPLLKVILVRNIWLMMKSVIYHIN